MSLRRVFLIALYVLLNNSTVQSQLTYANLKVEYDSAWTYKNLQLIPVRFRDQPANGISSLQPFEHSISLAQALSNGKAKIKEVLYKNGADINWLEVSNTSKKPMIINSGDLLGGGKQDRMVGETKIIPPGESDYLKVYCIEKGRWDKKVKSFNHRGSANIQMKKVMDLSGRQNEVWKEIERQFASENKTSDTWPYLKLYNSLTIKDSGYIKYFTDKYKASNSAYAGFLAVTVTILLTANYFLRATLPVYLFLQF